jgi:phosphatidylethanolamine-binding protein
MTDPDLMKANDPINKQVRHWVQPGLTLPVGGTDQLKPTRGPHTTFLASAPLPGTGPHRYVFILAREHGTDPGVGERNAHADFKDRLQFSAGDFVKAHGLEVVGVSYMTVAPNISAAVENVKLTAETVKHAVTG